MRSVFRRLSAADHLLSLLLRGRNEVRLAVRELVSAHGENRTLRRIVVDVRF